MEMKVADSNEAFLAWMTRCVDALAEVVRVMNDLVAAWGKEIERALAPLAEMVVELVHAVEEAKRIQRIQRRHPRPQRVLALREQAVWRWRWSPMYGRR